MIQILKIYSKSDNKNTYVIAEIKIPKEAKKIWKKYTEKHESYSYVVDNYENSEEKIEIWFKTDIKYGQYLCTDRIDAFVVSLLYYAMITGENITSSIPISEKLKFNLNNLLIPTMCKNTGFKEIKIEAPTNNNRYTTQGKVGTGMSCGIDSLHTLYNLTKDDIEVNYKITHLTFLDTGASHYVPHLSKNIDLKKVNQEAEKISYFKEERARTLADKMQMDLIKISSNVSDIYQGLFGVSHIYRNLSAILIMQKFFNVYYYSSAGLNLNCYNPSLSIDPAYAELITIPYLSTETTEFICGSKSFTRFEKTKDLCEFKHAYEVLNVCSNSENCGKCSKCYRTLISLDILGELDKFKKVFDIDQYRKNRYKAYIWLLNNKNKEDFANEIYMNAKKDKKIPLKAKIFRLFYVPTAKLYHQIKKIRNA